METDYYQHLLDEAQNFVRMAAGRLNTAKDMLRDSGSPAHMLAATKAKKIIFSLLDSQNAIDDLPAELSPAPKQTGGA